MIYIALLSLIVHSALQQYILTILNSLHLQFYTILKSNQMLVFAERGKPEYPEKNLSEQSIEPTNSAHLWRRVRESNPDTLVEGECSHHCANPAPQMV